MMKSGRAFPGSQMQDRAQRGISYRLRLAARNSVFCEASLNHEKMHNDLIFLLQPMLNMKDIGRHDFHIVNSYMRSLSFKNG